MEKQRDLNIVLITGTLPHHKYWAYRLFEQFNVVGIFHPRPSEGKIQSILHKVRSNSKYGFFWFFLRMISIIYQKFSKYGVIRMSKKAEQVHYGSFVKKYDEIPLQLIYHVTSVNNEDVLKEIKALNADLICLLGGEIVGKELINTANIASLNFHSGLSPFYNGANTIYWAVSDFRPNFAGGTLMYITERIDGGPIIMQYLPSIEASDTASSLFMKNIQGAVRLYSQVILMFEKGEKPTGIVQQRSFRYVRGIEWTIVQDLRLKLFHKKGGMKKYTRNEQIINYNNTDTKTEGSFVFKETLSRLLNKKKHT